MIEEEKGSFIVAEVVITPSYEVQAPDTSSQPASVCYASIPTYDSLCVNAHTDVTPSIPTPLLDLHSLSISTQVIDDVPVSTQVIDAVPMSTQVLDAVPMSSQVIDAVPMSKQVIGTVPMSMQMMMDSVQPMSIRVEDIVSIPTQVEDTVSMPLQDVDLHFTYVSAHTS